MGNIDFLKGLPSVQLVEAAYSRTRVGGADGKALKA